MKTKLALITSIFALSLIANAQSSSLSRPSLTDTVRQYSAGIFWEIKGVVGIGASKCLKNTNQIAWDSVNGSETEDCLELMVDSQETKSLLEKVFVGNPYSKEGFARLNGYALGYIITGVFSP
jgi:hypothetical protein